MDGIICRNGYILPPDGMSMERAFEALYTRANEGDEAVRATLRSIPITSAEEIVTARRTGVRCHWGTDGYIAFSHAHYPPNHTCSHMQWLGEMAEKEYAAQKLLSVVMSLRMIHPDFLIEEY